MRLLSAVALQGTPWRHPWQTSVRWNGGKTRWEARIKAGMVNALPATVRLDKADWPREFTPPTDAAAPLTADVPLTLQPILPLSGFRSLGADGTPVSATATEDGNVSVAFEGVPEFFAQLGVAAPPQLVLDGGSLPDAPTLEPQARLLRACDLVLHVDRPATATQWTLGSGVDGTFAQFGLTTTTKPDARSAAYITSMPLWAQPPEQGNLLAGDVADSPVDDYLLATVFLLSPPNAQLNSDPGPGWHPFVRHELFWNLHHALSRPPDPIAPLQLSLNTGLAGGVADPLNNAILASINDANSAAAQFLSNGRIQSLCWTV